MSPTRCLRVVVSMLGMGAALVACADIPTPRVLDEADEVSASPAAQEVKQLAPPAWARAEKRRLEAHEALKEGPHARAQFMGEEAIALYQEGVGLARLAKSELRSKAAEEEQAGLAQELETLQAAQERAAADVEALTQRLQAAQTVSAAALQGPEAEAARKDATRSFLTQAKLLCGAARLLGAGAGAAGQGNAQDPTSPEVLARDLGAAEAQIGALDAELADVSKPAPLDAATRARAQCSSVLSRVRRSNASGAASKGASADELLQQISTMGVRSKGLPMEPGRDERGVVITLRDVFEADGSLKASARERLAELDRVASAHTRFPIAIVVHSDANIGPKELPRWQARGAAVAGALSSVDKTRTVVLVAADTQPLVASSSSDHARNARIEIVFIAPEAL